MEGYFKALLYTVFFNILIVDLSTHHQAQAQSVTPSRELVYLDHPRVQVYHEAANGSVFRAQTIESPFQISDPQGVQLADFNNDGFLDMIVNGTSEVAILANNGRGFFGNPKILYFSSAAFISEVSVGDLNRDGLPDVAIATINQPTQESGEIVVYYNDRGNLGPEAYTIKDLPALYALDIGDINGDGAQDLVYGFFVTESSTDQRPHLSYLLYSNNASANFRDTGAGSWSTGKPSFIQVFNIEVGGDRNGDGSPEILASGFNFASQFSSKRLNNATVGYGTATSVFTETDYKSSSIFGDFDGDGIDEILFSGLDTETYDCFLNTDLVGTNDYSLDLCAAKMRPAYLNDDRTLDVIVGTQDGILFLENRGGANFEIAAEIESATVVEVPNDNIIASGPLTIAVDTVQVEPNPNPVTESDQIQYALWNGFLGMTDILELVNNSSRDSLVKVDIFRIDGSMGATFSAVIAANNQLDLILNDLEGFSPNSYGIAVVKGDVTGRVVYYRAEDSFFSSFDYALAVPLTTPIRGESTVGYNTFQPNPSSDSFAYPVDNWLTIVNLGDRGEKFDVEKFNQNGATVEKRTITVPAFGRQDIDGGHVVPGPSNIGLIRVTPRSNSTPYLSQLVRYSNSPDGGYDYAVPYLARPIGERGARTAYVNLQTFIDSHGVGTDWLELVNSSCETPQRAEVVFYSGGDLKGARKVTIPYRGQLHMSVLEIMGAGNIGHAEIYNESGCISVSRASYYSGSTSSYLTMHSVEARSPIADSALGSYNLFLGMESSLNLINVSSEVAVVKLSISSTATSGSTREVSIAPHSTLNLGLHDYSSFNTAQDSYGTLQIEPRKSGQVLADILRIHKSSKTGLVDFVTPTAAK